VAHYMDSKFVDRLRDGGKSYENALADVAKALGKSYEHIRRLYSRGRGQLPFDSDPFEY
jgi:hypothetical protein